MTQSLKTREKFELYKPKKFLGQNFLVDDNIAGKIAGSLGAGAVDEVVEIGPGRGALTKHLADRHKRLTAVEYDKAVFRNLLSQYGERADLVQSDFLEYDLKGHSGRTSRKLFIIGNIPYNITSKILFKLFDNRNFIQEAVLMVQKEVALRLTAGPGTKDYGILSVQAQAYCRPGILFHVPPTAFFPKPAVKSAVARLVFSDNDPVSLVRERGIFKSLVRESFGQRRKMMSNSLKGFFVETGIDPGEIDFDFSRRPETLSPDEFIQLANSFSDAAEARTKQKTDHRAD